MDYKELREYLKRIEFNKTEPEVLVKLIEAAQKKGEKARRELTNLRKMTDQIIERLEDNKFFSVNEEVQEDKVEKYAVGIDGSYQLIGGVGGKWYLFLSVARVLFENGVSSQPKVNAFHVSIDEIDEQLDLNVEREAKIRMFYAESKAILNWGNLNVKSIVFIDGPIVDPPFRFRNDEKYIEYRCEALRTCLKKSLVIGCIKRIRDRFFIKFIKDKFGISELEKFPTDQHLMLLLFTKLRQKIQSGSLYTTWVDSTEISESELYKKYEENGIYVVSFFYEKDIRSKILRIDIPFTFPPSENKNLVNETVKKVVNILDYWTYPGQDPLPVLLAHEKCNIRRGAAEILYEEILTKSRSIDYFDQLVASRMR